MEKMLRVGDVHPLRTCKYQGVYEGVHIGRLLGVSGLAHSRVDHNRRRRLRRIRSTERMVGNSDCLRGLYARHSDALFISIRRLTFPSRMILQLDRELV